MKRVFKFRTILAIAILLFAANGIFAQILVNYQNVAETSYQTAGKDFRLYVMPDLIYSPSYVAATNTGIDASAQWAWTYPAGLTGAPLTTVVQALNYVTFSAPVTGGPYTVSVAESNTLGGCTGNLVNQVVQIIDAPTAQFTTADILTGFCGNQAAQPISLTITENIANALGAYAFTITESVDNIDNLGAITANVTTNNTFVNFTLAAKAKSGTPGFVAATPSFTYGVNSSALAVQNAKRTQYTYTLVSPAGVTSGAGIVSAISQKSDYLAGGITGYAYGAKKTVVFIVNPAPVTGPIYHIPNSYAY